MVVIRWGSQHHDEYIKVRTSIGIVMVKIRCVLKGGYNRCTAPEVYLYPNNKHSLRDLTPADEGKIQRIQRH